MPKPGLPLIQRVTEGFSTRLAKLRSGPDRNENDRPTLVTAWMMTPFVPSLSLIEIVVRSVSSWILKMKLKRKMETGLGRTVHDSELTSIAAWMKVPTRDLPSHRDSTSD